MTKKLPLPEKKTKMDLRLEENILFNLDILDLNQDNIFDDDFVEAIFVYVHAINSH